MSFLVGLRLPEAIERGAIGGLRFHTTVLELESGFEKRNINWSQGRGEWDIGYGLMQKFQVDPDGLELDLDQLQSFFYVVFGKGYSFAFKDWMDYEIGIRNGVNDDPSLIALGDGIEDEFQIVKTYTNAGYQYVRIITKPIEDTIVVFVDGVLQTVLIDYTVDPLTGIITFAAPPGDTLPISIRCEFDTHVRFDTDDLKINLEIFNAGSWPNIPIVELRGTGIVV